MLLERLRRLLLEGSELSNKAVIHNVTIAASIVDRESYAMIRQEAPEFVKASTWQCDVFCAGSVAAPR